MKSYSRRPLIIGALLVAAYYIALSLNGQRLGFHASEALFITEKSLIIWQGIGDKIPVLGLTFPVFPFFFSLPFCSVVPLAGPVLASSLGMALLFFLVLDDQRSRNMPLLIQVGTALSFLVHPGLLFTATSGQSTYCVLLFGYLFFRSLLTYFQSNTTYHLSMASLFLLGLVFSEFDFIWLTLFLLPLILFISLQSLSLRGEDTLLRLGLAFNNVSLRRKLVNKSLALSMLLFMLPMVSLFIFSMLNRVYAGDSQYFIDNPYANANVLTNQLFRQQFASYTSSLAQADTSLFISIRRLLYAPLILLGVTSMRNRTYQLLTLASPLLLVEFLHIKDPAVPTQIDFYQIFLVLGWASLNSIPLPQLRYSQALAFILMLIQIGVGSYRLANSSYPVERSFARDVLPIHSNTVPESHDDDDLINFVQKLPEGTRILTDDATAFTFIARTERMRPFLLGYQQSYLSALDNPTPFVQYILIHNTKNDPVAQFSMTNALYIKNIQTRLGQKFAPIKTSTDWIIYQLHPTAASRPSLAAK